MQVVYYSDVPHVQGPLFRARFSHRSDTLATRRQRKELSRSDEAEAQSLSSGHILKVTIISQRENLRHSFFLFLLVFVCCFCGHFSITRALFSGTLHHKTFLENHLSDDWEKQLRVEGMKVQEIQCHELQSGNSYTIIVKFPFADNTPLFTCCSLH